MDHDLIVVGGGAAGLAAVRAALWVGADVALVTDSAPGGDCTFTGCVPSKTLLAAARDGLGFAAAMARVRSTVEQVAATESAAVLRAAGVTVIEGRGRLATHDTVAVGKLRLTAARIIVATGSTPSMPDIRGLAQARPLTSETVFDLTEAPRSLAIIGGGPTGCELAQAFAVLGVEVTLIEHQRQLLADEPPEAAAIVREALQECGVSVRRCFNVTRVEPAPRRAGSAELSPELFRLAQTREMSWAVETERVLAAAGRVPATSGLGLEEMRFRLTTHSGHILTDDRLQTSVRGVYAAGDVAAVPAVRPRARAGHFLRAVPGQDDRRRRRLGRVEYRLPKRHRREYGTAVMLSHAAAEMGRLAAANALGKGHRGKFRRSAVPRVVFTDPEVASVGCCLQCAPEGSRVAYLPLSEVDRAITDGRTDGFITIVAGPRPVLRNTGGGRILGATIVAPRAGEMIQEIVLAMRAGIFTGRLAQASHAYPSWSSGVQKAAAQFFGEIEGRSARHIN